MIKFRTQALPHRTFIRVNPRPHDLIQQEQACSPLNKCSVEKWHVKSDFFGSYPMHSLHAAWKESFAGEQRSYLASIQ